MRGRAEPAQIKTAGGRARRGDRDNWKGNTSAHGFYNNEGRLHEDTDSNSHTNLDMRRSFQKTHGKMTTAKTRVSRGKNAAPEGHNEKLSRQLMDLTKIGKDLKKLAREQRVNQLHLNKLKSQKIIKEADIRHEWSGKNDKERELLMLVKKYPGMRYNKNIQNHLELLRGKKSGQADDEDDPHLQMRGLDLHQVADAGDLLAKSDKGSNFEVEQDLDLEQLDAEDSEEERASPPRGAYLEGRPSAGEGLLQARGQPGNQSLAQLERVKEGLKACKGKSGFFNPAQALNRLNDLQKQEDPRAYEPEVVKQQKALKQRQNDARRRQELQAMEKLNAAQEIDKALFDFDEDIDHLEDVGDRYPAAAARPAHDKDEETPDSKERLRREAEEQDRQLEKEEEERKLKEREEIAEVTKKKIAERFQVKRAERPKMPSHILDDLEKMKKQMTGTQITKA